MFSGITHFLTSFGVQAVIFVKNFANLTACLLFTLLVQTAISNER
ncbi:hypothetical protein X781_23160 [Mannheimia sp. USDA-ARS-USMARC-1261]|nr:hypothetical protein X781_23160 [Mannheimia sp. USDA-ARS-USMARC-1261]